MSEVTHTPGPWTAQKDGTRVYAGDVVRNSKHVVVGYLDRVAECEDINDDDNDRQRRVADARLIAASPDLLDALTAIVKHHDDFTGDTPKLDYSQLIDNARAAISKATGA